MGGPRLRAAARCSPTCRCCSTTPARSSPSGGTRSRSRTTGTRATSPRPCATTWPCSGWSPGGDREILTLDELIAEFRLEDVKSAGAIFDERKLQAVNAEYLRALPADEFVERAQAWLRARWEPLAPLVQERARTLAEVYAMTDFLYLPTPVIDPGRVGQGGPPRARRSRRCWPRRPIGTPTVEMDRRGSIHEATVAAGEDAGVAQLGKAQAPIRLAVTGRSVGPPLWESLGRPRAGPDPGPHPPGPRSARAARR